MKLKITAKSLEVKISNSDVLKTEDAQIEMELTVEDFKGMLEVEKINLEKIKVDSQRPYSWPEPKPFPNKNTHCGLYQDGETIKVGDKCEIIQSEFCVTNYDKLVKYDEKISGMEVYVADRGSNTNLIAVTEVSKEKKIEVVFEVYSHWLKLIKRTN